MYIKKVSLINVGPYSNSHFAFPLNSKNDPIPILLIGENGAGKSIFLSIIVNAVLAAQQIAVENTEVKKGKVFKFRSPDYIKSGEHFYYALVEFGKGFECSEWHLDRSRTEFERDFRYSPNIPSWANIPENDATLFSTNYSANEKEVISSLQKNVFLYFPPNRFEEPAWLNFDNLNVRCNFQEMTWIQGNSNRSVINYSPLRKNQEWLLDLIMDREIGEKVTKKIRVGSNPDAFVDGLFGYHGPATTLLQEVIDLIKIVFRAKSISLNVNNRRKRRISVSKDGGELIPNIFQFSSGELALLNLFLTVVRDFDLTGVSFQSTKEITGVVVIDEVDSHIHTSVLFEILPKVISAFPKVQFILTTHSPFLVLGCEKHLTQDGVFVLEAPTLKRISSGRFSEFSKAMEYLKDTKAFEDEVERALETRKLLVFVEGDYDIRYINAAAIHLKKTDVLNRIQLIDAEGFGNLNKVQQHFDSKLAFATPGKILLLYDCDVKKQNKDEGLVFRRVVPSVNSQQIKIGVENLISNEAVDLALRENSKFFNITPEIRKQVRGQEVIVEKSIEVNKDEKRNLCDWLIQKNEGNHFLLFGSIFTIIEEILSK